MHVNVIACGLFGSVSGSSAAHLRHRRQDRAAELKRAATTTAQPRLARRRRHLGILIPPSITMGSRASRRTSRSSGLPAASCRPLVMALYSGYIALWSLLNPESSRRPSRASSAKSCGIANLIPVLLLIALVFGAAARLGDGDRMRPGACSARSPSRVVGSCLARSGRA
jgi:TRAP-type C4-dicarboxylate transport system permease large subunit